MYLVCLSILYIRNFSNYLLCFTNFISLFWKYFRKEFHGIVLVLDKIARDGGQLLKGGYTPSTHQMRQRIGIKPSLADCLDGLRSIHDMHKSELSMIYLLFWAYKSILRSAIFVLFPPCPCLSLCVCFSFSGIHVYSIVEPYWSSFY